MNGSGEYSLGDCDDIEIVDANMEEAGRTESDDGRADVAIGNNLYPEDVRNRASIAANV